MIIDAHALQLLRKAKAENAKLLAHFSTGPRKPPTFRSSGFVSQDRFGEPVAAAPAQGLRLDERQPNRGAVQFVSHNRRKLLKISLL
jgi:hypothetical protein